MIKNFESIAELVQDQIFLHKVSEHLETAVAARLKRPEPKPGYRYVRDWYDRMSDSRHLHREYFASNIEAVWNKRSNLNSEERRIINDVCTRALYATHKHYQELPEPAEVKPKRTRKKKAD